MVWEIERGECGGFSRLETEFSFQVSCTPIWNLVYLKLDPIRLWHFKQSWRSCVALQLWLLQLGPKLNGLGVTRGGRLMFQSYFWGCIRFLNQEDAVANRLQGFGAAWPSPCPCARHLALAFQKTEARALLSLARSQSLLDLSFSSLFR